MSEEDVERRRYFRINDEIVLYFRECNAGEIPDHDGFGQQIGDAFSLTASLNHLGEETRQQLRMLEKSQPDVAAYLKVLDQKINLLAKSVLMNDMGLSSEETRHVNLSASGLAFWCDRAIDCGSMLELKMILPPSLVAIATYGKVVHCNQDTESPDSKVPYYIGVELYDIDDNDREILIRHIVKKQMVQLRGKKKPA